MGFFSKIFKGIGKFFTKIGKGIKKAFTAFGKFTNKLGIVGQIGMMFIMPALGSLAMKGLTTLGSGFMTGLNAAAQGTGALSGIAKVTHGIFSTVANVVSTGVKVYKSITGAVSNVFKGITNGLKSVFNIPVDAGVGESLNIASNALSDYSQMRTVDPYAIAGKVTAPDPFSAAKAPYADLAKSISLDDPSKGFETTPIDAGGTVDIREIGRPLPAAEQARADFNASAAAGSEIAQVPIATTEPLVTAVAPSEPGIFQRATKSLVQKSIDALMEPTLVNPELELDYSRQFADKSSLHAMSQAENTARGYGAPLVTPNDDWDNMVASNPYYDRHIQTTWEDFMAQSLKQPVQPMSVG